MNGVKTPGCGEINSRLIASATRWASALLETASDDSWPLRPECKRWGPRFYPPRDFFFLLCPVSLATTESQVTFLNQSISLSVPPWDHPAVDGCPEIEAVLCKAPRIFHIVILAGCRAATIRRYLPVRPSSYRYKEGSHKPRAPMLRLVSRPVSSRETGALDGVIRTPLVSFFRPWNRSFCLLPKPTPLTGLAAARVGR